MFELMLSMPNAEISEDGFYGALWHDVEYRHVIAEEGNQFFVRDEHADSGPYATLAEAFAAAQGRWFGATLAPANRLRHDIAEGDENDGMQWLVEYLAEYGTADIDAQALAQQVFERLEEN